MDTATKLELAGGGVKILSLIEEVLSLALLVLQTIERDQRAAASKAAVEKANANR
jgi:hypothetical protein